jgi:hypothetical protein
MTRRTSIKAPKAVPQAETDQPNGAETKIRTSTSTSKIDQVVALLRRPQGATIEAMIVATGWQAHTVRGAMSGTLKKKAGLAITSEKADGVRTYRIAGEAAA